MSVTANQAAQHYITLQHAGISLIEGYKALDGRIDQALSQVGDELAHALSALAEAYLPTLDADAFQYAQRLTGFRGFTRRDPLKAMEREGQVLRKSIARIEGDERYRRREYLVGPAGELTRARAEAASMLEPWERECATFEDHAGFKELVQVGYDTPAFAEHFWDAAYWKHWAAGDRICEALEMEDFGDDILPAWRKADAKRNQWQQEVAKVDTRIDEVHNMVRQRDQAQARLPRLAEIYLQSSQDVLARHLQHADPALLDAWLRDEKPEPRPIRLALRRVAGLAAKQAFIEDIKRRGIAQMLQDLRERVHKYGRKTQKYMRPKYRSLAIAESNLDRKFERKVEKLRERQDKVSRLVDRLLAYNDYERFEVSQEPELWWIEMTGKRPSSMTPGLRSWYDRHPDLGPTHDPSTVEHNKAVAAAAADRDLDDLDYLS